MNGQNYLLCLLGITALMDLKNRRISLALLGLFVPIALWIQLVCAHKSLLFVAGGVLVGAGMLLLSKATRGGVGSGDGYLLCVTGLFLGFVQNLTLLAGASFLTLPVAAVLWIHRWIMEMKIERGQSGRKNREKRHMEPTRKQSIPFVPFLLLSYLCLCWLE